MVNILPAAPLGTTDQMSPRRAAVPHREIYQEIRDAMVERHPEASAVFLLSYSRIYADSQAVGLRRIAEENPKTASLSELIKDIKRRRREFNFDNFGIGPAVRGRVSPEWQSPDGFISTARLNADLARLKEVVSKAKTWVDKQVAHVDKAWISQLSDGKVAGSITYAELHQALDDLCEIAEPYIGYLRGYGVGAWTPAINGDWKAPLRPALFPALPRWTDEG